MDARYVAGDIGSRELMGWDMEMLPDDPDLLRAHAAAIPQDRVSSTSWRCAGRMACPVEVVSDGLGFYVRPDLAVLGLPDLPVATNQQPACRGGAAGMAVPVRPPDLLRVRHLQARARPGAPGRRPRRRLRG